MKYSVILLLLACFSLPSSAQQDALIWGSGTWGTSLWTSSASVIGSAAAPIPLLPTEGLIALIVLMALLPFTSKIKQALRK